MRLREGHFALVPCESLHALKLSPALGNHQSATIRRFGINYSQVILGSRKNDRSVFACSLAAIQFHFCFHDVPGPEAFMHLGFSSVEVPHIFLENDTLVISLGRLSTYSDYLHLAEPVLDFRDSSENKLVDLGRF